MYIQIIYFESKVACELSVYGSKVTINTFSGHTPQERYVSEITQLIKLSQSEKPEILWHYTSSETIPLILKSNSLRFTHASSFADTDEVNHSLKFGRIILDTLLPGAKDARERLLMEKMGNQMIAKNSQSRWYISCFTDSCESDFHWKNYSSDSSGCCLGLDTKELIKFFSQSPESRPLFLKTIYDTLEMINFGSMLLSLGIDNFKGDYGHLEDFDSAADRFLLEWGKHVDPTSVMFKKENFCEEREWRLGRSIETSTKGDQPFMDCGGKKRWDVTKSQGSDCSHGKLPIKNKPIGRNSHFSVRDLSRILEENGFSDVELSKLIA